MAGADLSPKQGCSINQTVLGVINNSLSLSSHGSLQGNGVYRLDARDLDLLTRFQTRTILTMGTARSAPVYQKEVFAMACIVSLDPVYSVIDSELVR